MKNKLTELFEHKQKNLVSVYFTAGFPALDDTAKNICYLQNAGVDFLEVGMPFSDPLADGPTIQMSSSIAISNGMSIRKLFEQLEELKSQIRVPLVLMGYLNPILQYGEKAFLERAASCGVSGLIIPDMPLDYYKKNWQLICAENNLSNIFLVTPQTSEERIKEIDRLSNGFIYAVSSNSLTGQNKDIHNQQQYFERLGALGLKNPFIIGFGIHDKHSLNFTFKHADGAIIGSAYLKMLSEKGISEKNIIQFINQLL